MQLKINIAGLYFGIGGGLLLLLIAVLLGLICMLTYHTRGKRQSQNISSANPVFATTEVTSFSEMGRGFEKKRESYRKPLLPSLDDPLEFPRGKLEMTRVILGE